MTKFGFIAIFAAILLIGCTDKKGPLERTGERIDEIGENIAEGDAPLKKKGALEKTGEAIDDAVDGK